jgi:hypothetical protein
MEKRIAQIIAIIFHPILVPTYGLLLLFSINSYFNFQILFKARIALLIMMFSSTVAIPLILFIFYKRINIISGFHMIDKEERIYPYLSMTVIYFLLYYLFSKTELPPIFSFYILSITMITLVVFFINLKWKISAHATAIGGLTAMMIGLSYKLEANIFLLIALLILCSGLVGFARLKTNSHKPAEVYSGYFVGVVIFLVMFLLF